MKKFSLMKKRNIVFWLSLSIIFGSLTFMTFWVFTSDDKSKAENKVESKYIDEETRKVVFEDYATSRGSGIYIEKMKLGDDYAVLDYYKSYKDFKSGVDFTNIKESQYNDHWTEHDRYKRMPLEDAVFLFVEYNELKNIQINYGYAGLNFNVDVDRDKLEEMLKLKFPEKRDLVWEEQNLGVIYQQKTVDLFTKKFVKATKQ